MAAESSGKGGGGIVQKTMRIAVPVLILVAVLIKFDVVAAGNKAPDFVKPKPS